MAHDPFVERPFETMPAAAPAETKPGNLNISLEDVREIVGQLRDAQAAAELLLRTVERAAVYGGTNHGRPERARFDEAELAEKLRAVLAIVEKATQS